MASKRLVLPWPLSPDRTLKRGWGVMATWSRFRKLSIARARTCKTGDSEPHGHDHAQVVVAGAGVLIHRANHTGVELAVELQADLRGVDLAEENDDVVGVEADGDVAALVVDVELLLGLAEVGVVGLDAQRALGEGQL